MKTANATFMVLVAIAASGADSDSTVKVTGGQIRGAMLSKGGAVFKGIPYAQPPVGELRWREPMPFKPWTGVRDATAFGAICAQVPSFVTPNAAEISKEDCLFLNVWTPEWPPTSRKPVMVWIPGGGNYAGGSTGGITDRVYDGEYLARRGVVLVTLNYRLGSLGFFAHPELTRESRHNSSGNQGFLDQIAALMWVRDNIARFGGDANSVTIFGQSAGSLDIAVLMTSPLSKGLFRRAIGASGAATAVFLVGDPPRLPQAEKRGETFAARWKAPAGASRTDLRAVSGADILAADVALPPPNFGVTIDGYVLPKNPAEVFATAQEHRVALMVGSNSRERIPGSTPPTDLKKAIEEAYGPLARRAQALYVGGTDPFYGTPADQWVTDTSFRCPAVAQAAWHAAAGNPTFEYEFARVPPGSEALGSTHGSELSYVFGTLDRGIVSMGPFARATAVDAQISDVMQQYWVNFARTGNPNGGRLPMWPKFEDPSRAYLQFTDAGPMAKEGLRRPFCDVFIENVKRRIAH